MAQYNCRIQVLFTQEQHEFIKEISKGRRESVGETIRFAIDSTFRPSSSLKESNAFKKLSKINVLTQDIKELS